MHVIEDDQGRRMGVIQEIQSNAATEERRTARGDASKKFFSPEASYTLDLLRESEEGRRVFEAAARSSKPRDTALEDAVGELGQMADDAYNEMGNDLPIIGGVNETRLEEGQLPLSCHDGLRDLCDGGERARYESPPCP